MQPFYLGLWLLAQTQAQNLTIIRLPETVMWPGRSLDIIPLDARIFIQDQDGCTADRQIRALADNQELIASRIGSSYTFHLPGGRPGQEILLQVDIPPPNDIISMRTLTLTDQPVEIPSVAPELTVKHQSGSLSHCPVEKEWYSLNITRPPGSIGAIIYDQAGDATGLALRDTKTLVAQRGPCFSAAALNALGQTGPRSELVCPGGCSGVESKGAQGFGLWGLLGILTLARRRRA